VPLVTDNIFEARAAYAALETRVRAAEERASALQATVDALTTLPGVLADRNRLLLEYSVGQLQANAQLTAQQAGQVSPDTGLGDFIGTIGLAAALGEASMPDRVISSISATVQSYVSYGAATTGAPKTLGLRLYQPELGGPTTLTTTSFEIAKVPPAPSVPAPRSLYAVLQAKQSLFTAPFWAQFATGTPLVRPAQQIVAEIAKLFAGVGGWTVPLLVQEATTLAALETTLASLIGTVAPADRAARYAASVQALAALAKSLDPSQRTTYVAGDLGALTAALDLTTGIAATIGP
jgi:hypothetical protein